MPRSGARSVDALNPKPSAQNPNHAGAPEGQQQAELGEVGRDAALGRAQSRRRKRRAHLAEAQLQQEVEHLAQRLACARSGLGTLNLLRITMLRLVAVDHEHT